MKTRTSRPDRRIQPGQVVQMTLTETLRDRPEASSSTNKKVHYLWGPEKQAKLEKKLREREQRRSISYPILGKYLGNAHRVEAFIMLDQAA